MMEKEAKYLLHLLGAYVRGAAPESGAGMDLGTLRHLANIHSVEGVFSYMAMKYRLFPEEGGAFRAQCMAVIGGYAKRAALADLLFGELSRRAAASLASSCSPQLRK